MKNKQLPSRSISFDKLKLHLGYSHVLSSLYLFQCIPFHLCTQKLLLKKAAAAAVNQHTRTTTSAHRHLTEINVSD